MKIIINQQKAKGLIFVSICKVNLNNSQITHCSAREQNLHGGDISHSKTQTMQTADLADRWLFLTLESPFFSVLQLQNPFQCVPVFVVFPQATQTQHLTVDSIHHFLKSLTKEPPKLLSSSGIRESQFTCISVSNFSAQ